MNNLKVKFDSDNNRFIIPLIFSVKLKKLSWTETNKSVNMNITQVTKVVTNGLEDQFTDTNSAYWLQIMEDLKQPQFRINDELVNEDSINRDTAKPIRQNNGPVLGQEHVARLILDGLLVDLSSNSYMYPFDESKVRLEQEFFDIRRGFRRAFIKENGVNSKKQFPPQDKTKDIEPAMIGDNVEYAKIDFRFQLQMNFLYEKNIQYNDKDLDRNMETHDVFSNYLGYQLQVKARNKIEYNMRMLRTPNDIIKTAIGPLILLIFLSLATTSFGDPQDQLANLLAVQLAQGQFIQVFKTSTLDTKSQSVADVVITLGIFINVIQFTTATQLSQSQTFGASNGLPLSSEDQSTVCRIDQYQMNPYCWPLQITFAFLCTLFLFILIQFNTQVLLYQYQSITNLTKKNIDLPLDNVEHVDEYKKFAKKNNQALNFKELIECNQTWTDEKVAIVHRGFQNTYKDTFDISEFNQKSPLNIYNVKDADELFPKDSELNEQYKQTQMDNFQYRQNNIKMRFNGYELLPTLRLIPVKSLKFNSEIQGFIQYVPFIAGITVSLLLGQLFLLQNLENQNQFSV